MLFCREFHYWRIYAFFVLILGVQKCACAIFYAFCMSGHTDTIWTQTQRGHRHNIDADTQTQYTLLRNQIQPKRSTTDQFSSQGVWWKVQVI